MGLRLRTRYSGRLALYPQRYYALSLSRAHGRYVVYRRLAESAPFPSFRSYTGGLSLSSLAASLGVGSHWRRVGRPARYVSLFPLQQLQVHVPVPAYRYGLSSQSLSRYSTAVLPLRRLWLPPGSVLLAWSTATAARCWCCGRCCTWPYKRRGGENKCFRVHLHGSYFPSSSATFP